MIKQNEILADLHMHTTASLHAYSSLSEMVEASRQAGYKYIAITDHLFTPDDRILRKNETARIEYLSSRMRYEEDIKVIGGVELNLNQFAQDIHKYKRAECWMPVGLHSWFVHFKEGELDSLLPMFKKFTDEKNCTAFAHIERDHYKFGNKYRELCPEVKKVLEDLVQLAVSNQIPLEVNETSFILQTETLEEKIKYWLSIAKDLNAEIYLGSDAHYHKEIGHFENALRVLNELNYPKDLIINIDENKLNKIVPSVLK